MLSQSWRNLIYLSLLIFCIFAAQFLHHQMSSTKKTHEKNAPDFFIQNLMVKQFNENGKLNYTLHAEHLTHFEAKNHSYLSQLTVFSYPDTHSQQQAPWKITALKGEAWYGSDDLLLKHHVKIEELSPQKTPSLTLTTNALSIFPKKNLAYTAEPVTIIQPGLSFHAVGMRIHFKKKKIEFLHQSQGIYDAASNTATHLPSL